MIYSRQIRQIIVYLPEVWKVLEAFRAAVPLWGQTAWTLSGLSPKRDFGPERITSKFIFVPTRIVQHLLCTLYSPSERALRQRAHLRTSISSELACAEP